jgi:hypothetical protein
MEIPQQDEGKWDAMASSLEEVAEEGRGKTLSNRKIEG